MSPLEIRRSQETGIVLRIVCPRQTEFSSLRCLSPQAIFRPIISVTAIPVSFIRVNDFDGLIFSFLVLAPESVGYTTRCIKLNFNNCVITGFSEQLALAMAIKQCETSREYSDGLTNKLREMIV